MIMTRMGFILGALLLAAQLPAAEVPRPKPLKEPPDDSAIRQAIQRGVDFMVARQNKDGSWGSPRNTKGLNIYAPTSESHRAFRLAVTALTVSALIEAGGKNPKTQAALARGEAYLLKHLPTLRRATADAIYNVWAHCYGIQALVRMRARLPKKRAVIDAALRSQYDKLTRYASIDGGWGYYDFRAGTKQPASSSISFVNATALLAFHEAREAGVPPPERLALRAIAALKRQRLPDGSYLYGEYLKWRPRSGINRPGGSLGRSQACNLALRLWGDKVITDQVMIDWLDRLFARNEWLGMGRKRPVPHESWFAVAGYFYYYGHFYAAFCIEQLPPKERQRLRGHLAHTMLPLQERDGSWWDFPFYDYHQQYGTAMAVMTLHRCRPETEERR